MLIIGRTSIIKMSMLSKAIYILNEIPIKIPAAFLTEVEQTILKFVQNHKRLNSQSNLEKEKQSWRYHNSRLQVILLKMVVIKTVWYWHKNRPIK